VGETHNSRRLQRSGARAPYGWVYLAQAAVAPKARAQLLRHARVSRVTYPNGETWHYAPPFEAPEWRRPYVEIEEG
jgi:hypothetical protein